jgi:hypothetical protein
VCTVLTPPIPTSKIIAAQCGASVNLNTSVFADNFGGATLYRFKIENTILEYSYVLERPLRTFDFSQVPGVIAGQTYQVSVSVQVGGAFGPYGAICNLTISGATKEVSNVQKEEGYNFIVTLAPNPFGEYFGIDLTSFSSDEIEVKIYDMLGKLIQSSRSTTSEISQVTFGANFPSGVYNVIVSQGENIKTLRVIKR